MSETETIKSRPLDRSALAGDPFKQFAVWFAEAQSVQPILPEAMSLATADRNGCPSSRMVLLKGVDERGFLFFTNYESRKAANLDDNPYASLLFWWPLLERQVRIEGAVERVTAEESDDYFATRARGSQLGAWASHQSSTIDDEELSINLDAVEAKYRGQEVPRPQLWGGYRLIPELFEFWQGRPSRLHDRFRFQRTADGWNVDRLAP
ncbi:MAG: pyridoxamine 5'-phosphate oxidase [Acidobacteriota bacterium]